MVKVSPTAGRRRSGERARRRPRRPCGPRRRDRLETSVSRVDPQQVDELERELDRLVAERPLRPAFVVPGANPFSAALDLARAVLRRAERHVILAAQDHEVSPQVVASLNRLGDLLYVLARRTAGDEEPVSHT
ncbi:MAG: ATP:cob(I)alamin adenosyltransferase [Gaiellaceae bacterium]